METTTTEWEQSAEVAELFAALAKAQGDIEGAAKGKDNPFFKSKYADLAAVWDACRAPLSKNGLCVIQQPFTRGSLVGLRTQLGHSSGQWIACIATAESKDRGPQAYGSVVTYLRRYALQAFAGVASEDDDGEGAEGRKPGQRPPGANWGKPANGQERSAPKAVAGTAATRVQPTAVAAKPVSPPPSTDPDTGEVLDAGQLVELTEAFDDKWGKGARTAAPSWLKAQFGTDNPANLTKSQASEALQKLLAS